MKRIDTPEFGVKSKKYAEKWEEGFVVGNGNVAGLIFGGPLHNHVILNAPDYFLKIHPMQNIPHLAPNFEEFRNYIETDGYDKALQYYEEKAFELGFPGFTRSDPFHPLLQVDWLYTEQTIMEDTYQRVTDYSEGFVSESFLTEHNKMHQKRLFTSSENELILIIEAEETFSGNLTIKNFQEEALKQVTHLENNKCIQKNLYLDETGYTTEGIIETDGKITQLVDGFSVRDATTVVYRIKLDDGHSEKLEDVEQLFMKNCSIWKKKYQETSLEITTKEQRMRTIDDIIHELESTGEAPLVLYEKLYAASRYVLLCCSGKSMPNLQGIWSGTFQPPWSSDYTFNTNLELAISSLTRLGMFEEMKAVFNRLEDYFPDFEENALNYFGCRGYIVPAHGSTTAKEVQWSRKWPHLLWTSGAAWLAHFYAEYYEYTKDKEFLENTALPFYQNVILFYEDFLIRGKDNIVLFRPSYSPENGMGDNATFDIAAVKETLLNLITAYNELGIVAPKKYQMIFDSLPSYAINDEGILKEWGDPNKDEIYNHRHFSQFYPIFESKEIQPNTHPKLWEAAEKGFERKMKEWVLNKESGNSSSHGRMHAAMIAIALGRSSELQDSLDALVKNRSYFDSLVTAHYDNQGVFNVDANGSLPRVYHDSILYSPNEHSLNLFQATPIWLRKGIIKGIQLPNQIRVLSFIWDMDKAILELILESKSKATLEINFEKMIEGKNNHIFSVSLNPYSKKKIRLKSGELTVQ